MNQQITRLILKGNKVLNILRSIATTKLGAHAQAMLLFVKQQTKSYFLSSIEDEIMVFPKLSPTT